MLCVSKRQSFYSFWITNVKVEVLFLPLLLAQYSERMKEFPSFKVFSHCQLCHKPVCLSYPPHSPRPLSSLMLLECTHYFQLLWFFSPLIQCSCSPFYSPEAKEVMSHLARKYKNTSRNPREVKTCIISVLSLIQNSSQVLCWTTEEVELVSLI